MSSSWDSGGPTGLPPLPPELDPRGRRHQRRHRNEHGSGSGRTVALRSAQVIAAALSVLLLVTFGLYWWRYRTFTSDLKRIEIAAPAPHNSNAPKQDIDGEDQNILIVGNDDRTNMTDAEVKALHTGRDGGSLNTDTMMIVHVPADGKRATLISLPRDAYVEIPGYGKAKLNSAYTDGYRAASGGEDAKRAAGANLLIQTVQNLTGLTLDHYVQVDLLGFYRISKAIGGVKVNMCAATEDSYTGLKLHKGVNTIEGVSALAFVRQRHHINGPNPGDLARVKRQQYFLTAAFRKMASAGVLLNPISLQNLLNAVKNSLYLDKDLKPLDLARQLENLTANNIISKTIPFERFADVDVGSVEIVDPAKVQAFVAKVIGPSSDSELTKAKTVDPSTVTVTVLNAGSGVNGAAHASAASLREAGFTIGEISDSPTPTERTTIEYAEGMEGQAKTLKQYVPGATLRQADVDTLTLLLGANGIDARSAPAQSTAPSGSSSSTPPSGAASGSPSGSSTAGEAIDRKCIY